MAAITIQGPGGQGGTYLLRLHLSQATAIRFGRFHRGNALTLPTGDYLYLGSALAEKGATSLARRLLRHATRSTNQPPHPIRPALLSTLREAGLGAANLQPPRRKACRWHIDYLLDEPAAELQAIWAWCSSHRLESRLAQVLTSDPATWTPAGGLGASDAPGQTHLLGLHDAATWWATWLIVAPSLIAKTVL